jgi:hypothetical protein
MINQTPKLSSVPTKSKKTSRDWIILYSLPFWYGATTRLPLIYFVIHMKFEFHLEWLDIGFYFGSFQAMRMIVNVVAILAPQCVHIIGSLGALAGYIVLLVSSGKSLKPFLIGTVLVGSAESLACMQTYLKKHFKTNLSALEKNLKIQYTSVTLGVAFAFGVGGVQYKVYGIDGVAILGIMFAALEFFSIVWYFILSFDDEKDDNVSFKNTSVNKSLFFSSNNDPPSSEDEETQTMNHTTSDELTCENTHVKVETSHPRRYESANYVKSCMNRFPDSDVEANYLNYMLCMTFGIESITIGYNFSVSPIYILERFDKDIEVIGILLAAGATVGALANTFISLTSGGTSFFKAYAIPSPYNLLIALNGVSLSVALVAVPIFPVHVVGMLLLMMCNDIAALLLNELQGAITTPCTYSRIGPMGQIVRRIFNVIAAISGPVLFGICPSLPYAVAGIVTLLWTLLLVITIGYHMRTNRKVIQKLTITGGQSHLSMREYDELSFSRQEIIVRLMNSDHAEDKNDSFDAKNLLTNHSFS